jgi:hypothetical protein
MNLNWKSPETRKRLQEAIFTLTNPHMPHIDLIDLWLDAYDEMGLQDFSTQHALIQWMTGNGVIEAAIHLVKEAFESGNIDENGNVRL